MPNLIRNLGLGFIWDDDELVTKFLGMLMEKGKVINGYYGCPNIFTSIGNIDFFVKTKKNDTVRTNDKMFLIHFIIEFSSFLFYIFSLNHFNVSR